MKLTREQLGEIMLAVQLGLSRSDWEGVTDRPWWEYSDEAKIAILDAARSAYDEVLRERNPDPLATDNNQQFLDRMNLASINAEEAKWREWHLTMVQAKTTTLSGLRQATNDSLSHIHYWSDIQKMAVERRLAAGNLPKLAMLEVMLRKKHERILKRGRIRNEEEFYLVQEILSSLDFPVSEEDRNKLTILAGDFETRPKKRRPSRRPAAES